MLLTYRIISPLSPFLHHTSSSLPLPPSLSHPSPFSITVATLELLVLQEANSFLVTETTVKGDLCSEEEARSLARKWLAHAFQEEVVLANAPDRLSVYLLFQNSFRELRRTAPTTASGPGIVWRCTCPEWFTEGVCRHSIAFSLLEKAYIPTASFLEVNISKQVGQHAGVGVPGVASSHPALSSASAPSLSSSSSSSASASSTSPAGPNGAKH